MSLGSNSVLDTLVHVDLLDSINRAYLAVVDIQYESVTQATDGEEIITWVDHATMVNIGGTLAKSIAMGQERRTTALTVSRSTLILDLDDYYPDITDTHRANVTTGTVTQAYNIFQVVHDSQRTYTRLELEEVEH
jgi:hypothetical protein